MVRHLPGVLRTWTVLTIVIVRHRLAAVKTRALRKSAELTLSVMQPIIVLYVSV